MSEPAVVTGAFSYTGRAIAERLLKRGVQVRTLTGHPDRSHVLGDRVPAYPLDFDDPQALQASLEDADVLFNTYWVRLERGATTFDRAVRNTSILFDAARRAGVRRIVHISITNPDRDLSLPYFEGKAAAEQALMSSGMSYGIVRPTVMFGRDDVFINNMAWLLRRFPLFLIPGAGDYRLQPVFVEDVADLCIQTGYADDDVIVDAAGPEVFTFAQLLELLRATTGASCSLVRTPPRLALWAARVVGRFVGDELLTEGELVGLMRELIVSSEASVCPTRLSDWLRQNADTVGSGYVSELKRNYFTEANSSRVMPT